MPLSNLIDEFQPIIAPGFETDFLKASVAYMQNPKDKLGFNSFAYSTNYIKKCEKKVKISEDGLF